MVEEETGSVGANTILIDCATTAHMLSTKPSMENHAVDTIGCRIRMDDSCGHALAERKGTQNSRIWGDKEKPVPLSLDVLIMPELDTDMFLCERCTRRELVS